MHDWDSPDVDKRRWYHWVGSVLLGGLILGPLVMYLWGKDDPGRVLLIIVGATIVIFVGAILLA
jgi:hypothetical protein